eukprot:579834-Prorocentrum_minimum.AAC.1
MYSDTVSTCRCCHEPALSAEWRQERGWRVLASSVVRQAAVITPFITRVATFGPGDGHIPPTTDSPTGIPNNKLVGFSGGGFFGEHVRVSENQGYEQATNTREAQRSCVATNAYASYLLEVQYNCWARFYFSPCAWVQKSSRQTHVGF